MANLLSQAHRLLRQALCVLVAGLYLNNVVAQENTQVLKSDNRAQPSLIRTLEQAKAFYDKGDDKEALFFYEQALPILEKRLGPDNPRLIMWLITIGSLRARQGDSVGALPLLQRSLDMINKNPDLDDHDNVLIAALSGLASVHLRKNELREAASVRERILSLQEKVFGGADTNLILTLSVTAGIYFELKEYSRSLALYQRTLDIEEKAVNRGLPESASVLSTTGRVQSIEGQFSQSNLI